MKTLHDSRYFAACKNLTQQKKVLTDFVNSFFRKNEVLARKKEPPMDLKSALDLATASLTKAGIHHLSTSIYSVEPYSGSRPSEGDDKDAEIKKLRVENAQLRREVDTLKRKVAQTPRKAGGYGGRGLSGGTHPSQMSLQEKVAVTCKDW